MLLRLARFFLKYAVPISQKTCRATLGLNYTHAAAKKIGPKQARVMHRVFCGVTGLGMAMHIFAVKQPKE